MGIPNATHQAASNTIAGLGNWISLHTGSGAGTTGANEASGGGYARVQSTPSTPDGLGDNTSPQVNIPCAAGTYTEGGIWSTASGSTLAAPSGVTPTGSGTGGTLAAATYYYVITAFNQAGETTASSEVSVTTSGTTSSVQIVWSHVSGVYNLPALGQNFAGYRIYRGTASAAENLLVGTASASATSWTDTGFAGTSATPPVSNTASTFIASAGLVGGSVTVTGTGASVNVTPTWTA